MLSNILRMYSRNAVALKIPRHLQRSSISVGVFCKEDLQMSLNFVRIPRQQTSAAISPNVLASHAE